ncbi:MAG TPA: hypothetical protein VIK69_02235 [Methylophilaceae bacterium]
MTLAYPYLYGTNIPGAGQGSVATVTNGSRIVTGTGGAWTSALEQGDLFLTGGAIGLIEEIISDTELRLALNWTGANITNGAYVVMRGIAHTDPRNYGRKLGEYLVRLRDLPDPGDIGDVFGPSGGVVNNEVVVFDTTTGKKIKASNGVTARARGSLQVDGQLDVLGPNIVMRGAGNAHFRFRNADGSLQNAVIYWASASRNIAIAIYDPDGVTIARQLFVGENLLWNDGSASRTIWHSGNLPQSAIGRVVQSVYSQNTAYTAITANIPLDNTVPQIGEGTQVLAATITPSSATNRIRMRAVVPLCSDATANRALIAALFVGGSVDAVRAYFLNTVPATAFAQIVLEHNQVAGTTAPVTVTVRAGASAGTAFLNGGPTQSWLGGAQAATLTVEEIRV